MADDIKKDYEFINQYWNYGVHSITWLGKVRDQFFRKFFKRQAELNASFVRILNDMGSQLEAQRSQLEAQRSQLEAQRNILRPKVYVDEGAQIKAGGDGFDYYSFEQVFRPAEVVKERQRRYIEYFKEKSNILDVGSGRGEFLELLKENGIEAIGVDSNADMISRCKEKGLNAVCADFKAYLSSVPDNSLGGIFSAQFIEHIPFELLDAFCKLSYRKLKPGGVFIAETINPYHLAAFRFFYVDPTHVKPLYPEVIEFLCKSAGFQKVQVIFTMGCEGSEEPWDFPEYAVVAEKT